MFRIVDMRGCYKKDNTDHGLSSGIGWKASITQRIIYNTTDHITLMELGNDLAGDDVPSSNTLSVTIRKCI